MSSSSQRTHLDCKTMRCPMPIVELGLLLQKLEDGDEVEVEATDPAFLPDIRAWVDVTGCELLSVEDGEVKRVVIKK